MKTIFPLLLSILCLFFGHSVEANMSDHQKRAFLENLATSFPKKRIFYRWQSEQVKKNLLEAGEMTPNLYQYYMNIHDSWAGPGMYVSEDIVSSSQFGTEIIQLEIGPDYKYLNLLDQEVQKKLASAGLTNEDVYKINPQAAIADIKEGEPYWVLKGQKGIRFKEFSPAGANIHDLAKIHTLNRSPYLTLTIEEEVFKRARKNLSSVVGSHFINILGKKYDKRSIQNAVSDRIKNLKNIDESVNLMKYARAYLSPEKIIQPSIPLVKTAKDGAKLIEWLAPYMEPSVRKKVIDKIISLVKTAKDGANLIQSAGPYMEPSARNKVIDKTIPLVKTAEDGGTLLFKAGKYLDPSERKEFLRKSIVLIKTAKEGVDLLYQTHEYLDPSEHKKIVKKSIPMVTTLEDGVNLLKWADTRLESLERREIILKTIPLIKTPEDSSRFLLWTGEHLDPLERKKIIRQAIGRINTSEDGAILIKEAAKYLAPSEKRELIGKSMAHIKTSKYGVNFLVQASDHLTPSDRKEIIKKSMALIKTPEDGSVLLKWAGEYLDPSARQEITSKSLHLLSTPKNGVDFLHWSGEFLTPSERKNIVKKSIALLETLEEGVDFLKVARYLDSDDTKQIAYKLLQWNEEQGKKHLETLLDKTRYREIITEFETHKKARLNCLKKQLLNI